MSMNVRLILHVILTPPVTTQLDRSLANVIMGMKEMEPTAEVCIVSHNGKILREKCYDKSIFKSLYIGC